MKCAIMQPTYLPWSGYFNLISLSDTFVFLDTVQFERQSWQSRNRILLQGAEHYLTVPVERSPLETTISEVVTSERRGNWRQKHFKTLQVAYGKARYGKDILEFLETLYILPSATKLSEFNISIIKCLSQALNLKTKFMTASSMNISGERTERLISICESLSATVYLSPSGSRGYLEDDGFIKDTDVSLEFHCFTPRPYMQYRAAGFTAYLSIIDVIANIGFDDAREYVLDTGL